MTRTRDPTSQLISVASDVLAFGEPYEGAARSSAGSPDERHRAEGRYGTPARKTLAAPCDCCFVQDETAETFVILVAEWIVGDDGVRVRLGDRVHWEVRPTDAENEGPFTRLIAPDRADAGQPALPIFVRHADDP